MKKSVIFISISLVLIILFSIGVSYSLWNISVSQDTTNLAESKCFDLSISNQENSINLDNAYPISNEKGKSLTPYTFTVINTCDITAEYSVNLEVLNNSTLSSKFIDVMLENNDIKEINLLSNFDNADKVNTSSIESRKLTTGILKSGQSKDYSLRLWIDYNTTLEDLNNEIKTFKSKIVVVGKPINFSYTDDMVFNFDYTGTEQTFVAPVSGTYKLETWGAQGGSIEIFVGGAGGYSIGIIRLKQNEKLCINIGGTGDTGSYLESYNGGGGIRNNGREYELNYGRSGGGATHIATKSGILSDLKYFNSDILIVSGGGGSGNHRSEGYGDGNGGSGGGFIGNDGYSVNHTNGYGHGYGTGGTQSTGGTSIWNAGTTTLEENWYLNGTFGQGASKNPSDNYGSQSGGGGGYYGGGTGLHGGGGGGSGYIGNTLLTKKVMYCYNCEESNEESTKTISTTCSEETPTSYCAKKGNGYARITLVSIDE